MTDKYQPDVIRPTPEDAMPKDPAKDDADVPPSPAQLSTEKTVISQRAPYGSPLALDGALPGDDPRVALAGRQLLHFQLEEFIGGGGMGLVFRGTDLELGRPVAVKVLMPQAAVDEETVRRFRQEAQSAARLNHKNIAQVYYVGEADGWNFIAFEFVEGENVRDAVIRQGQLPLRSAVEYVMQVALALEHAHQRGVIHRDIKPSNIVITPEGQAKLVDMGLARLYRVDSGYDDLTASGVTLGTFDYISPEQGRDPRSADIRSDLYSLGCTLYFMLTGQPPFPDGTVLQKLLHHTNDRVRDPRYFRSDIPVELVRCLGKLLAKSPKRRHQHPRDLYIELARIAETQGLAMAAHPDSGVTKALTVAQPPRRPAPARFVLAPVLAVAIIALLADWIPSLSGVGSDSNLDLHTHLHVPDLPPAPPPTTSREAVDSSGRNQRASDTAIPPRPAGDGTPSVTIADAATAGTATLPSDNASAESGLDTPGVIAADAVTRSPETTERLVTNGLEPAAGDLRNTGSSASTETTRSNTAASVPPTEVLGDNNSLSGGRTRVGETNSRPPTSANTNVADGPTLPNDVPDSVVTSGEMEPFERQELRHVIVGAPPRDDAPRAPVPPDVAYVDSVVQAVTLAEEHHDLQTIELMFDGPRRMRPLTLNNLDVTIRAARGYRPILQFHPRESDAEISRTRMISVVGGNVRFEGVSFEFQVPVIPAMSWALFGIDNVQLLKLEDCWISLASDGSLADQYSDASVIDVVPSPGTRMMQVSQTPPALQDVVLENCVVRGVGDLLHAIHAQPLRLAWSNGLLATTQHLARFGGSPAPARHGENMQINLDHVTAIVDSGLCEMTSDAANPHWLKLGLTCTHCILVTHPDAPLIAQVAPSMPLDAFDAYLEFSGQRNFYERTQIFWSKYVQDTDLPEAGQEELNFEQWQQRWGKSDKLGQWDRVQWERRFPDTFPRERVLPEHFAISDQPGNPARGVAGDGRDAGVDAGRLPRLPEFRSADDNGSVREVVRPNVSRAGELASPGGLD